MKEAKRKTPTQVKWFDDRYDLLFVRTIEMKCSKFHNNKFNWIFNGVVNWHGDTVHIVIDRLTQRWNSLTWRNQTKSTGTINIHWPNRNRKKKKSLQLTEWPRSVAERILWHSSWMSTWPLNFQCRYANDGSLSWWGRNDKTEKSETNDRNTQAARMNRSN